MKKVNKIIGSIQNRIKRKIWLGEGKRDSIYIEKELIYGYLPKSAVIIDCGAHIGSDTIEFAKYPESKIYAFEPVKTIYQKLIENTRGLENVYCFNLALSNYNGEANMYISSGVSDGSSSLLKPKKHINDHPDVFFNDINKVECKTLDTWGRENNVTHVDMLWLDMQGAEQKMLMESTEILSTVRVIHTEVSLHETYEGAGNYKEFKDFLKTRGFKAVVEAIPKGNYGGNVLFVKESKIL